MFMQKLRFQLVLAAVVATSVMAGGCMVFPVN